MRSYVITRRALYAPYIVRRPAELANYTVTYIFIQRLFGHPEEHIYLDHELWRRRLSLTPESERAKIFNQKNSRGRAR